MTPASIDYDELPALIRSLLFPEAYSHRVKLLDLLETHISWVILTGEFAYKIKKPVALEFVDFSTLARREHFCREEIRLNRRLAPRLYLDVVPITGSESAPQVAGQGAPIEFAVKMAQFPQESLLTLALPEGRFTQRHIDELAAMVARFHSKIAVAGPESPFGSPAGILAPARANLEELADADLSPQRAAQVVALAEWTERQFERLEPTFASRKQRGFVRECHGDMHLGNMLLDGEQVMIFDGIDFNEHFRWIDVMNEIAFCTMDLLDHGRPDLAIRFVNGYLERTGDYEGVGVLRFYVVYRALVRAKVALIRHQQAADAGAADDESLAELCSYLDLAQAQHRPAPPTLAITHGLSGSGKTRGSEHLVESLQAIRVRSDVERKRLFGRDANDAGAAERTAQLYSPAATAATYERLGVLSGEIVRAGYSVIVDATFLRAQQRDQFRQLAQQCGVAFRILSFRAAPETLRARIVARRAAGEDASDADLDVLHKQLQNQEPLAPAELAEATIIDSDESRDR